MTARLERLLCWRESTERWAHYQAMPPVLILAHSQRQAVWWHVCAEKAAARLRVDPPGGAIACLEEHAGQPSPWQWTWRRLVSQEQVHLREILTPLPLDALPQDLRPVMPDPLTTPVLLERPVPWEGETRVGRSPRLAPVSLRAPQRAREWGKPAHLAWVSLHLSARQWELLLLLFAHPLLSNEELAALLGVRASSMRVLLHAVARWDVLTAQDAPDHGRRQSGPPAEHFRVRTSRRQVQTSESGLQPLRSYLHRLSRGLTQPSCALPQHTQLLRVSSEDGG